MPFIRLPLLASAFLFSAACATASVAQVGPAPQSMRIDAEQLFQIAEAAVAAGDLTTAERAYRAALAIDGGAAAAWNNLAYALAGQRRWREALQAAETSVTLGGGGSGYADTLREVRALAAGEEPSARRRGGS